jgi:hypothetical protein
MTGKRLPERVVKEIKRKTRKAPYDLSSKKHGALGVIDTS